MVVNTTIRHTKKMRYGNQIVTNVVVSKDESSVTKLIVVPKTVSKNEIQTVFAERRLIP